MEHFSLSCKELSCWLAKQMYSELLLRLAELRFRQHFEGKRINLKREEKHFNSIPTGRNQPSR